MGAELSSSHCTRPKFFSWYRWMGESALLVGSDEVPEQIRAVVENDKEKTVNEQNTTLLNRPAKLQWWYDKTPIENGDCFYVCLAVGEGTTCHAPGGGGEGGQLVTRRVEVGRGQQQQSKKCSRVSRAKTGCKKA